MKLQWIARTALFISVGIWGMQYFLPFVTSLDPFHNHHQRALEWPVSLLKLRSAWVWFVSPCLFILNFIPPLFICRDYAKIDLLINIFVWLSMCRAIPVTSNWVCVFWWFHVMSEYKYWEKKEKSNSCGMHS